MFLCSVCGKLCSYKRNLTRHTKICNADQIKNATPQTDSNNGVSPSKHTCEKCLKTFSRKDNLKQHRRICKGALNANQPEPKNLETVSLKRTSSPTNINQAESKSSVSKRARFGFNNEHLVMQEEGVYLVNTAYKNRIATYRLLSNKNITSVNDFLNNLRENIISLVRC
ncbi:zinc finger protein 860-like isoform X2 [Sitophilus oryzae]|uniref:Zinc finger protein 860-like isoform X2 n=1 Tax=Sitophilus oryzae TaxID=7048 RepID=A0A6J2YQ42_SITOR|nr:zinc finger protein 860-like isoform X2 [Sitophilus oryzae]